MRAAVADVGAERDGAGAKAQPAGCRYSIQRDGSTSPCDGPTCSPRRPRRSLTARQRLIEEALLLERFAEDDVEHLRVAGVVHLVDPRAPAIDEGLRVARVLFEDGVRGGGGLALGRSRAGSPTSATAPPSSAIAVATHVSCIFLAVDDVLVSVVGVVLPDQPRAGLVLQQHRQLLAVEFLEKRQQIGHEFCFSLQVMQTRVHGMAFSRAGAIGSPQSRHTP